VKSPEGLELAALIFDAGYRLAPTPGALTRDQIDFIVSALNHRRNLAENARMTAQGWNRIIINED
jgi:hypothetical protein